VRGTNGPSPLPKLTIAQANQASWLSGQLQAQGWSAWYCLRAAQHVI
jgi:hypothetical protein